MTSLLHIFEPPSDHPTNNASKNRTIVKNEQTQLLPTNLTSNVLIRHDSEFSIDSNYSQGNDDASHLLNVAQGAILLTAECLGTGLLALPGNIATLGSLLGFFFLLLQLPINLYAGTILHWTALDVEKQHELENRWYQESLQQGKIAKTSFVEKSPKSDDISRPQPKVSDDIDYQEINQNTANSIMSLLSQQQQNDPEWINIRPLTAFTGEKLHHDTATHDFIGFTQALFDHKTATKIVRVIYYTNIFLVLGNYVLVMSHALQAVFVQLCLPMAGVCACLCMLGVSQLRTMARLGRTASLLSLFALLVVVAQCLYAIHDPPSSWLHPDVSIPATSTVTSWLRKFSALGSIGFAVGSQKLFLNIRHELVDRQRAPQSLALSLSSFGTFYVILVLLAGPNPPAFLLDAIPVGTLSKRIAGLLLYAHIVVSYAINSQALCSSLDRAYWRLLEQSPTIRWMMWTVLIAVLSYTVANAIPFFSDLVSFIGAITSVPLTLLLPAVFWRKRNGLAPFGLSFDWSCALTYFSLVFMITATAGSVYSIQQDWSKHGAPFSCQLS
jgi:amino acid permease